MVGKKSLVEKAFDIANIVVMIILSLMWIYPFWYVLILSFHDSSTISYFQVTVFPLTFTLTNYRIIFQNNTLLNGFIISVLRTSIGAISSVFVSAMFAYSLSKKHLLFRKFFLNIVVITMFFSGGLIPAYLLYKNLNLLNSFWIYIIPSLYGAWTIILMKTFFLGLPQSIEESAQIDGANDLYIFMKLVIPMSMPLIATMLLFSGVGHWNDWITAQMFITNSKIWPIQTILMKLLTQYQAVSNLNREMKSMEFTRAPTVETVKMATIITATVPILCSYPFLQKYFIKGIMIGSIKE
ncbi:MAG: carbohydrate ABC transporter permease [Bacillota bacterium]|nr:carbohydrate ABC transporter permease [Bacillota bacterium]